MAASSAAERAARIRRRKCRGQARVSSREHTAGEHIALMQHAGRWHQQRTQVGLGSAPNFLKAVWISTSWEGARNGSHSLAVLTFETVGTHVQQHAAISEDVELPGSALAEDGA